MMSDETYMEKAISFARRTNKVWPFSAVLVDSQKESVLVMATDAAHISPIFHAESHCVHLLATKFPQYRDSEKPLTLYSTCECDPLSFSSIVWANFLGFSITRTVFGAPHSSLYDCWGWGKQLSSQALNETFSESPVTIDGPLMEEDCMQLFREAHQYQQKLNVKRPGVSSLSKEITSFSKIFPIPSDENK